MDDDRQCSIISGGVSRRGFLRGGLGLGLAAGLGSLGLKFWFDTGDAFGNTFDGATVAVPTTGTAPEQVHLTWGADPETAVTVSWLAPGTLAQPAPSLVYSASPIGGANPGSPGSVISVSFQDEMNLETAYAYHAELTGLAPGTTYYYQISDGAAPATTFSSSFLTAPSDSARTQWRFSSYGDLATPITGNPSGTSWSESSDNSIYAVAAVEAAQPLFHLLNGDLCYANLNYNSQPAVWRDFFTNASKSAANRPWLPCLGNHEIEWGTTVGASGLAQYNGANGYGTYLSRFDLPDNGVAGLKGNFYRFQVGTVLFVSLDADDVIYQDGGSYWAPAAGVGNLTATANPAISIPPGASTYNNQYTGTLVPGAGVTLVPGGTTPNQQTTWLADTLKLARQNPTGNDLYPGKLPIDMIVVQMHQCALSTSQSGNGSDLGIRQAWLPLFDEYGVDLVVSGHEHNYERSYAVRGYNPATVGTVVSPNPGQAATGSPVFTRQPAVVAAAQTVYEGLPAFDTSQGTVFLVLGGGGTDGPTDLYLVDSSGNPEAKVITQRNLVYQTGTGAWNRNGADSIEPAPWTAQRDGPNYTGTGTAPAITTAYGFAIFDVDPGSAPGDTVITMTYYHAPAASGGAKSYQGSTTYTEFEKIVFGHGSFGPPNALPEFATPALALAGAAVAGGAAYFAATHRRGSEGVAHQG